MGRAKSKSAQEFPSEILRETTARTIGHYERHAEVYRDHTLDHDVSQNRDALLEALETPPPFTLLDLGCGPGRDLAHFKALGHEAIGLEGSAAMAELARRHSGCQVIVSDFVAMDLPAARFDGVFANAVLFHLPVAVMPHVLATLRGAMKPRGVLVASNPRGRNEEGWSGERYCAFLDLAMWRRVMEDAGFEEVRHYYRPPGRPRREQPWLAVVWRKTG